MKINVELAQADRNWKKHKFINKLLVEKVVHTILDRYKNLKEVKKFEISILLTNDSTMLDLNSKFRSKNKATNVLSFPDIQLNFRHLLEFIPDSHYMYLGDIAFGYETIHAEAIDQEKILEDHFVHLLVHSVLHLLGYDHQDDQEADVMENLEIEILRTFSIVSPY